MNRFTFALCRKLYGAIDALRAQYWDMRCKHACISGASSRFMKEASIENLQRNPESIRCGERCYIRGELLVYPHGGEISIGDACYIGAGSRIWSAKSIKIGNRVLIAHNVDIHDANDHSLDRVKRHLHYMEIITRGHPRESGFMRSSAIRIEDDVWIGFHSILLKGVTIGEGSVVAAGSVVTKDVAPHVVVAGNPADVIKRLQEV